MNFILFQLKFIKFKSKIKFIKFELHNYGYKYNDEDEQTDRDISPCHNRGNGRQSDCVHQTLRQ